METPASDSGRTVRSVARWAVRGIVALLLLGIAAAVTMYMHAERRGPFATGTATKAFLSTTFEMSPQEVERALQQRLQTCSEIKTLDPQVFPIPELLFECAGESVDREWAPHHSVGFVPTLTVHRAPTFVTFEFFDQKLDTVEAEFKPLTASDAQEVIDNLTASLKASYASCARKDDDRPEESRSPGAYEFSCTKPNVKASLWFNPSAGNVPFISLRVTYSVLRDAFNEARKARDADAL